MIFRSQLDHLDFLLTKPTRTKEDSFFNEVEMGFHPDH